VSSGQSEVTFTVMSLPPFATRSMISIEIVRYSKYRGRKWS
jgi:hypothetical protein